MRRRLCWTYRAQLRHLWSLDVSFAVVHSYAWFSVLYLLSQLRVQGIQCAAKTEDNANWAATDSLNLATGTCIPGYSGSPTRACNADGSFGDIINPCTRTWFNLVYLATHVLFRNHVPVARRLACFVGSCGCGLC